MIAIVLKVEEIFNIKIDIKMNIIMIIKEIIIMKMTDTMIMDIKIMIGYIIIEEKKKEINF